MRHLGRADAEGERAEGSVSGGVAIAAIDQQARQGQPLLRPHHMHDPLTRIAHPEAADAVAVGVFLQRADHAGDVGITDPVAVTRRRVMIDHADGEGGFGHGQATLGQFGEGVVRSFMHQMAVHPQQGCAILAQQNLMRVPEFGEKGAGGAGHSAASRAAGSPMTGSQWRSPPCPTRVRVISSRKASAR